MLLLLWIACVGEAPAPSPTPPSEPLPGRLADGLRHAPGELAFVRQEGEIPRTCFANPDGSALRCPDALKGSFPAPPPPLGPWWVVRAVDDADGHAEQLATWDGARLTEQTPWRPQAREPAFRADGSLVYVGMEGRDAILIGLPGEHGLLREPMGIFEPTLAGDRAVFASSRDGNAELYQRDSDGLVRLTHDPGDDTAPSFASDGALAWIALRGGSSRLMLRLPGAEATPLPQEPVHGFAWSPDGARLALVVGREGEQRSLKIVARDGEERASLVFPGHAGVPAWSPDGIWLLVPLETPSGPELYVARSSGRLQGRWPSGGAAWLPRWRSAPHAP